MFDSGFGGLTVLKELQKALPYEHFIYLGDTARLPYGTRSREAIIRYTLQNCSFLSSQEAKLIVIACNTATSMALEAARAQFSIPIIGVIDPIIEQVIKASPTGSIGVLGTQATVNSGIYEKKIHAHLPAAKIAASASPLLVALVEEGLIDHPMTRLAIQEYIRPLLHAQVDTVILACTHFPLLKKFIEKALGPAVQVIDPAFATAQAVRKTLADLNLLSLKQSSVDPLFCVTDDPEKFARLGAQLLNHAITDIRLVEVEKPAQI